MENFLLLCSHLRKLITSKHLAAVICVACALLHLAACYPAQFSQLRAYCDNHMHYIDLIAAVALASLIVHGLCHLYTRLARRINHVLFNRSRMKEIQRCLHATNSEEYIILSLLYYRPGSRFNPMEPAVKRLYRCGLIIHTSHLHHPQFKGADLSPCAYTLPFNLTLEARKHLNEHSHLLPPESALKL